MATPRTLRSCSRAQMESGCVSGLLGKSGAGRSSFSLERVEAETRPTLRRSSIMVRQRSTSMPSFSATSASVGARCKVEDKIARGGFHLLVAAAHVARGPVELAQAVQNCALDAVLGIARKNHLLFGIEFVGGVEQAENAGVNQIVQVDVHRKILVHAHGDGLYQRQMLQHHPIAARLLGAGGDDGAGMRGVRRGSRSHGLHWHVSATLRRTVLIGAGLATPTDGTGALIAAAAAL